MTADIQLYRPDTGEFPPVRVLDGHTTVSAPYSRAVGLLDGWARAERRAVDEFSAWVEGQAAQALAEMRALCDELGLPHAPVAWADIPDTSLRGQGAVELNRALNALPAPMPISGQEINEALDDDPVAAYMAADDPDDRPGRAVLPARNDVFERESVTTHDAEHSPEQAEPRGWTPDPADYGPRPAISYYDVAREMSSDSHVRAAIDRAEQNEHVPEEHGRIDRWLIRVEQWWRRKQAERDQRMGVEQ